MPPHKLVLKLGMPSMPLRNMNGIRGHVVPLSHNWT